MKYLRKFETNTAYQYWVGGAAQALDSFNPNIEPFAALCLDTGQVYFHEYVNMTPNGYDYVDLGLPSGTLWATMNLGASTATDSGYYYSWGQSWSYSGYKSFTLGDMYNNENLFDKHGRLNPGYDAATQTWNGGWHIPTVDQCSELIDSNNTSIEFTTTNGVNCAVVTSLGNGNSVVFPLSGYYDGEEYGTTLQGSGTGGLYWTLDLYTGSAANIEPNSMANVLAFSSSSANGSLCNRYCGISIRPVLGDKKYRKQAELL